MPLTASTGVVQVPLRLSKCISYTTVISFVSCSTYSGVPNSEHCYFWMGEDEEEQEELGGAVFIADVEGTSIPGEQEGKTNERVEESVLEV